MLSLGFLKVQISLPSGCLNVFFVYLIYVIQRPLYRTLQAACMRLPLILLHLTVSQPSLMASLQYGILANCLPPLYHLLLVMLLRIAESKQSLAMEVVQGTQTLSEA